MSEQSKIKLKGKKAFYLDNNYIPKTFKELSSKSPLSPAVFSYKSKKHKLKKKLHKLGRFFPPYRFFWWIHTLGGKKALLPAANLPLMGLDLEILSHQRLQFDLKGKYKVKRISIEVDHLLIDAMIVGTRESFETDRWILFTNGNAEFYEYKLTNPGFYALMDQFQASALIFNYPGVGCSEGTANRFLMRRSSLALMSFLEDSQKGLGAKEIIGFGHSIGGGVQADLMIHHPFKKDLKYAFIKSRTFSTFARVATELSSPFSGLLVKLFGWNMKPSKASRKCKQPEIILQSALVHFYVDLTHFFEKITHDGVIPQKSSLAYKLLKKKRKWNSKTFMGIFEGHNQNLVHPDQIYQALKRLWKRAP